MADVCEVDGCDGKAVSYGLCDKHRTRLRVHGDVNYDHKAAHFLKSKHPLYTRWAYMAREGRSKAWSDFWLFVADVGAKPGPRYRLARHDRASLWSKENTEWRSSLPKEMLSDEERVRANARAKKHRDKRTVSYKRAQLLKRYGLTIVEFDAMCRAQNNLCAICGNPETAKSPVTGSPRAMTVDHDHVSGKIRGLLCSTCNSGIGYFKDDLRRLRAAIAYLESHAIVDKRVA